MRPRPPGRQYHGTGSDATAEEPYATLTRLVVYCVNDLFRPPKKWQEVAGFLPLCLIVGLLRVVWGTFFNARGEPVWYVARIGIMRVLLC
jgi:hypothetical protein